MSLLAEVSLALEDRQAGSITQRSGQADQ